MELHIVGWRPGLRAVSLTQLLNSEFGLSMADAKAVIDSVLSRSVFGEPMSARPAAMDTIRLVDSVIINFPSGDSPSEARRMLEEMGLVIVVHDTPAASAP